MDEWTNHDSLCNVLIHSVRLWAAQTPATLSPLSAIVCRPAAGGDAEGQWGTTLYLSAYYYLLSHCRMYCRLGTIYHPPARGSARVRAVGLFALCEIEGKRQRPLAVLACCQRRAVCRSIFLQPRHSSASAKVAAGGV